GACCCSEPEPEPEPDACPHCRAEKKTTHRTAPPSPPPAEAAPGPELKWVLGWQARQCRGDGPLGLFADLPAVPPAVPARPAFAPRPSGTVAAADSRFPSLAPVPAEPPPKCG